MIKIVINNITFNIRQDGDLPDFSSFGQPTLSMLQTAFAEGNYEIISDPEPIAELSTPNWVAFYKQLKISVTYQHLIGLTISVPNISGVMAALGIAIQDGIRDPFDPDIMPAFQAGVNGVLTALNIIGQPLTTEQLTEVRELLDSNGFTEVSLGE